jgi:hypothetical protein
LEAKEDPDFVLSNTTRIRESADYRKGLVMEEVFHIEITVNKVPFPWDRKTISGLGARRT